MQLVAQPSEKGCGQAAVATLCNRQYMEVAKYIQLNRDTKNPVNLNASTSRGILERAIRHFGRVPIGKIYLVAGGNELHTLQNDALINCVILWPQGEVHKKTVTAWKAYGHWVVWDVSTQSILDPYQNKAPLYVTRILEVA